MVDFCNAQNLSLLDCLSCAVYVYINEYQHVPRGLVTGESADKWNGFSMGISFFYFLKQALS